MPSRKEIKRMYIDLVGADYAKVADEAKLRGAESVYKKCVKVEGGKVTIDAACYTKEAAAAKLSDKYHAVWTY